VEKRLESYVKLRCGRAAAAGTAARQSCRESFWTQALPKRKFKIVKPSGCKKPLNRRLAIFLSVLLMWLVGGIGLWLMHSSYHWSFLLLGGYDIGTLGQIGSYYLARVGAQLPALALAAGVIGISNFQRPVRTACFTAFGVHGILTAIRLARNLWSVAPDLDPSIPILAELAQLSLLVVFIGLITRFLIWFSTWQESKHKHANL
jgi:hypothetical protein